MRQEGLVEQAGSGDREAFSDLARATWVLATVTPDGSTLLLDDFETGRLQALSLRGG